MTSTDALSSDAFPREKRLYNGYLLIVAGLGGLLYGIDVGIIGSALPYLQATSQLTAAQLSIIVAAVLLGSVFSTLFAGLLADWMGRKTLMSLSGVAFVVSIPVIALSNGYGPLFFGRLLQGMSGGFIGVVVPLYLAECLAARSRGKGTGIFQLMLTIGICLAAIIGFYYSFRLDPIVRAATPEVAFLLKDHAWRRIFWVSLPPGLLFVVGSFFVSESPRWLFRRGKKELARIALLRSRSEQQANTELREMEETAQSATAKSASTGTAKDSLLSRRYLVPFFLSCVILSCNTATGINSIIGYNTDILLQSGLSDLRAHLGYVVFTLINVATTVIGVNLVDRKGRKFLFLLGTGGIIVSLLCVVGLFHAAEKLNLDCTSQIQAMVNPDQSLSLRFDPVEASRLMQAKQYFGSGILADRASLAVIYSYGGFTEATSIVRSDDQGAAPIRISREGSLPSSKVDAFFKNPFADLDAARTAPLKIDRAYLGHVPDPRHGWMVALGLYGFMAFYGLGPGVCVWLALSELMPTRIRSNGMSVALVLNQLVATMLAAVFLPVVSKYGYSTMFLMFVGFTLIYFLTVAIFLPETKGKTLEEIEEYFDAPRRQKA